MARITIPVYQHHERNGSVASAAKLYFYENRSNPPVLKPVYIDAAQTIAMQNPITLPSDGYTPDVYGSGAYTIVLRDQHGSQLWARDDVAVTGADGGQFSDWSPVDLYPEGAISRDTVDGGYYISLTSNNMGNQPSLSDDNWSKIAFIKFWNVKETYNKDDMVIYGGELWYSAADQNTGNTPSATETHWLTYDGTAVDYQGEIISDGKTIVVSAKIFRSGKIRVLQGTAEVSGTGSLDEEQTIIADLQPADVPAQTVTGTLTSTAAPVRSGPMLLLVNSSVSGRFSATENGGNGTLTFAATWFVV